MDIEWRQRAACYGIYPPVDTITCSPKQAARIIADYCDRCRVQLDCAELALGGKYPIGVWAGVHVPDHDRNGARRKAGLKLFKLKYDILKVDAA